MSDKKISIIMGIYNCEKTLEEAINSILNQTYKNWKMIMCDDASNDKTYEIANKYQVLYPEKFVLLKNSKNRGLNYTLNKCLKEVRGEYVARMDADDISLPERFEKQIEILESRKDIDIVSSSMIHFDENLEWLGVQMKEYPQKEDFIYGTPFCHAPSMMRSKAMLEVKGYSVGNKLLRVEDYHLWMKLYMKGFKGMNIQEPLYKMRDDNSAIKRRKFKYRINESYVKWLIFKNFNLELTKSLYILKPILVGILPRSIYRILRKRS